MLTTDSGSLFRFLDSLDQQVTGRQTERPSPEVEARLRRLLGGEPLTKEERKRLFEQLQEQPAWAAWLAEQVKARRTSSPRSAPQTHS